MTRFQVEGTAKSGSKLRGAQWKDQLWSLAALLRSIYIKKVEMGALADP